MARLFRAIREVWREVRHFGDAEVATLKEQLTHQKAQLEELKLAKAERLRQEEALVLMELRRAIAVWQRMDQEQEAQQQAVVQAVDQLGSKMKVMMEADMHQRAANLMQSIDFSAVVTGEGAMVRGAGEQAAPAASQASGIGPAVAQETKLESVASGEKKKKG